ncbi:MAG TPA: hypothetical protein VNQ73_21970 [Ilumatobacter sp.]|nr:hypothetical protein [Ilumatobacter sp.]
MPPSPCRSAPAASASSTPPHPTAPPRTSRSHRAASSTPRSDSNVGPYSAPLGADQTYTFDGRGDVPGDCDLPTGATGLQLNVTAVGATQLTNLRFFPSGQATPTVSNLNPAPGQPPTPNAVTVTLDDAHGKFDVFNRFGQVDVVIDVAGYYTDRQHTGADIIDKSLDQNDLKDAPGVAYNWSEGGDYVSSGGVHPQPNATIIETSVVAPATGYVTVTATANVFGGSAGYDNAMCYLDDGTPLPGSMKYEFQEDSLTDRGWLAMTRTYPIDEGATVNYQLRCSIDGVGAVAFDDVYITAMYVPTYVGVSIII